MQDIIKQRIQESIEAKQKFLGETKNLEDISKVIKVIVSCFRNRGKVLICGNGGSAADAQHIAGELVDRFLIERKGLPVIALTTDTSVITAWGNDKNFNDIFARQVEALGKEGDILIGISTSGNSQNIINAIEKSKSIGLKVISLTGKNGGKIKEMSDFNINVQSDSTPRIQECHEIIYHIICELVEKEMSGGFK
jgi:D-sedoheptulose 7-phosphate isomerase